ncbi:44020a29-f780-49b0-84ec-a1477d2ccf9b [Thermothielavioides terrestris]|uniref:44020a29-f780-49b0-84ec-a1477d2ccf9b n=1 Tax=Thermothielavioides terrestris TaxID=2587410 RepID=A0A3S4ANS9_9PEZI|nr:44020a29-f780-49b0-84ec-a1477d2ccf9b [Thermothielavioides terrestris]
MAELAQAAAEPRLPRITIRFCTQCKWMLRAAYYAQELLSTFSTSLGEVALQPGTGGVFVVEITTAAAATPTTATTAERGSIDQPDLTAPPSATSAVAVVLWDRKRDGGFPETKELKRRS